MAAYVLAIHYHILNRKNNRKFLHMYCPIWNMPVHLHGSSMFRHYFKYFMGAVLGIGVCTDCLALFGMSVDSSRRFCLVEHHLNPHLSPLEGCSRTDPT